MIDSKFFKIYKKVAAAMRKRDPSLIHEAAATFRAGWVGILKNFEEM